MTQADLDDMRRLADTQEPELRDSIKALLDELERLQGILRREGLVRFPER